MAHHRLFVEFNTKRHGRAKMGGNPFAGPETGAVNMRSPSESMNWGRNMARLSTLCSISGIALMLAICQPAYAQTAPQDATAEAEDASPPHADEQAQTSGEIVVTGSRIARRDYSADSPIVTLGESALQAQGPTQLEVLFNAVPQFAAIQAATSVAGDKGGRAGANLRGLGIARTLVLLDGRRLQPSDPLGSVDLNTISPGLLSGVEVITGGASAVYGSDAIAGVVNLKLDKRFSGLSIDAQYGITQHGDGDAFDVTGKAGGSFADGRGHALVALSYIKRVGVRGASRNFFYNVSPNIAGILPGGVVTAEAANLPSQAALNSVFVGKYGGTSNPVRNQPIGVNRDGTLFTSTAPISNLRYAPHDPYLIDANSRVGFPQGPSLYLQSPLERVSAFARADYELVDGVTIYGQIMHTGYTTEWRRDSNTATSATAVALIPVTNPFIPADLKTILASRPNPNAPINFSFGTGGVGPAVNYDRYQVTQYLVGVSGKAWGDWTWDIYGSSGTTDLHEKQAGYIDRAAWSQLVNAADGGASVCSGGYNPFSPDPLINDPNKRKCYEFLTRTLQSSSTFSQKVVEATAQGGIMRLPAGDLRFAGGASYRKNAYSYTPDAQRTYQTVFPDAQTGPTSGESQVYEVFGELLIPVLKNAPLIKSLDLDVAFRRSDYKLTGSVNTYKASIDWAVFDSLRLRGGYQRAIRAPGLGELYAPSERTLPSIASAAQGGGDPCDVTGRRRTSSSGAQVRALCLALGVPASVIDIFRFSGTAVPAATAGNTGLRPEVADTYTVGAVWHPNFGTSLFENFSASVDYYKIGVRDAIGVISTPISLVRCFNSDGASNPSYDASNYFCRLGTRNPVTGQLELILQPTLNLAAYKTSGIDMEVDWRTDLGSAGKVTVNLIASWLKDFSIQNLSGEAFVDYSGTIGNGQIDRFTISYPKWKVSGSLNWALGPASLLLQGRYYSSMDHYQNIGVANPTLPGVTSRAYFDLSTRWKFGESLELRAGVVNLFDKQPPTWIGTVGDAALYDSLGRRFFIGFSKHF